MNKKIVSLVIGGFMLSVGSPVLATNLNTEVGANAKIGIMPIKTEGGASLESTASLDATASTKTESTNSHEKLESGIDIKTTGQSSVRSDEETSQIADSSSIKNEPEEATNESQSTTTRPIIRVINVQEEGSVVVDYDQPAKFLGIFSSHLSGRVSVDKSNHATVQLPWWKIFFSQRDTHQVEVSVAEAVRKARLSLNTNVQAEANIESKTQLVNTITKELKTSGDLEVAADQTTR